MDDGESIRRTESGFSIISGLTSRRVPQACFHDVKASVNSENHETFRGLSSVGLLFARPGEMSKGQDPERRRLPQATDGMCR